MLLAAVLLLALFAVSPPVECRSISRRSLVYSTPAELTNLVVDASKDVAYQAFGLIIHQKQATSASAKKTKIEPKIVCEGVLLSSRIVLTTNDCQPDDFDETLVYFEFMDEQYFCSKTDFHKAGNYDLIYLAVKPKKLPHTFPFLSWFSGTSSQDHRYGVREEFVPERNVYLSSRLAHKTNAYSTTNIRAALADCSFTLKDKLIALLCKQLKVCTGQTVLPGSAFFTFTQTAKMRIVSVMGLVSLRSSGTFCKNMNQPGGTPSNDPTPDDPKCKHTYLCGRRFTERSVRTIVAEARRLDKEFKVHQFMPSNTIIGSFNMMGVKKFTRTYAKEQVETVRNIIERADILALQETGGNLDKNTGFKLVIEKMRDRKLKAIDTFAFVYNSKKFSIVDSCETIKSEKSVKCSFSNNENKKKNQFTIVNVHLTNKAASTRYTELKQIKANIANVKESSVIIAGDFNTGAGKLSPAADAFDDAKRTMKILDGMHFPDPGPTTYRETDKESHFDRFAVSKTTRLMYTYYPELTARAAATAGTNLNGPIFKSAQAGNIKIPLQLDRFSTVDSSCPPTYHNYPILNQLDRQKYFYEEMVACHPPNFRIFTPNLDRTRDLSDHLPVSFKHKKAGTTYKVATWNLIKFDPTIDPKSERDVKAFSDRKEIKRAAKFTKLLNEFNIVAVQELEPFSRPGRAENSGSNAKRTKRVIMNKRWYWSSETSELGFAVDDDILVDSCEDISMTSVKGFRNSSRSAFKCEFSKTGKGSNTYLMTLISVHVIGTDASAGAGDAYRTEVREHIADDKRNSAYLVGDFNYGFAQLKYTCKHVAMSSFTFTKLDQFTVLDYVWPINQEEGPGVANCKVYNPELITIPISDTRSNTYLFDDVVKPNSVVPSVKTKVRMKAFAVWKSVSDHFPVYMKFFAP